MAACSATTRPWLPSGATDVLVGPPGRRHGPAVCRRSRSRPERLVRRAEQAELLRVLGAEHIVVGSSETYVDDVAAAVAATGATLGFDAIGGWSTASELLMAIETALFANGFPATGYGNSVHKQVYIYGGLDVGPIVLSRRFGFCWAVGGWLLTPFLGTLSPEDHAACASGSAPS